MASEMSQTGDSVSVEETIGDCVLWSDVGKAVVDA